MRCGAVRGGGWYGLAGTGRYGCGILPTGRYGVVLTCCRGAASCKINEIFGEAPKTIKPTC